ncbi:zinc finger protein squeeze-like isoform X2 [Clytia hemisphaerica]|uniref:zinc finger protein squeeze-like isoform X2 n=1 Tax=Clytia hemisphaerica TaxID=252671 RepID=UPI0034D6D0FB
MIFSKQLELHQTSSKAKVSIDSEQKKRLSSRKRNNMIDKILDFHLTPDGTAYYQIKWKTSWERADSLSQFGELLDEFWAKVKKASTANMFNNTSVNRKEPAIVPRPKPTTQQSNNTQQKNAPRTPTQKKRTPSTSHTPRTPQQQQQQQQQQQFFQQSQQIQQMQSFQPPPQQPPPATQSMGQPSSVTLIDSDDDDDDVIAINPPPSGANNMSFNSMNLNNIKLEDFDQKPQLGFPPQPFAGGLPPQQQSFMNPTNGRGGGGGNRGRGSGGTGGRGRGRGRGSGPSPAKRKLGMPPAGSATPPMKMEPQMGGFGGVKNENGGLAPVTAQSSWKDHFEVLENYVDGQKVHSSYKCLHCNAKIAQSSNCSRHLKTHLTSEEAEHECPICQKKFARLDYIERHLKQHGKGSTEEVKKMIKLVAASMKK